MNFQLFTLCRMLTHLWGVSKSFDNNLAKRVFHKQTHRQTLIVSNVDKQIQIVILRVPFITIVAFDASVDQDQALQNEQPDLHCTLCSDTVEKKKKHDFAISLMLGQECLRYLLGALWFEILR